MAAVYRNVLTFFPLLRFFYKSLSWCCACVLLCMFRLRVSLYPICFSLSLLSFSFSFYLVLMLFAYVSFFLCDFNLKRCRFFSNSFFVKANFELALYRSHSFLSAVWARSGKGNLNNTLDIMTDASSEGKMKKKRWGRTRREKKKKKKDADHLHVVH